MSDLDDNLKSDLRQYATDAVHDDEVSAITRAVDHIKQAFADAGYMTAKQWLAEHDSKYGEVMTGQEWYDRFKAELEREYGVPIMPIEELSMSDRGNFSDVLEAAKHAAGLENQNTNTKQGTPDDTK